jgi:peptidoglycan/xylan/chitin deacetylase (PgdA/CDA1 family)
MPATLYVVTHAVANASVVWVNELAWLLNRSAEARAAVAKAFDRHPASDTATLIALAVARYDPVTTGTILNMAREAAPELDATEAARREGWYVSWDEMRELASAGITIGNHTASHPVLGGLDPELQRREIQLGREAVEQELGACTSLAYPFGSYDAASASLAADCGHRSIMLVGERLRHDLLAVGRVSVRSDDAAGIFAELEVVAPLKAAAAAVRRRIRR